MNVVAHKIKVTVNGQVFEIPSQKAQELLNMLASWQSIAVTESGQSQNPRWNGQTLING